MLDEKWASYARTWSSPEAERNTLLAGLVTQDVIYTDPNSKVAGRANFSAHIAQFQNDMPGAYFEIVDVKAHHNKTLAWWRLCGADGNEIMPGTSYATLTEDGKFSSFSGFF